ncbi:hypothetical protein L2E82_03222 [Cichorium intybus]|uniref:Uncharacterized protein n=1 Tax=Cichorium intybus TaxID=13427 RepID=A0ACB9H4U4_CICIN|nr:hypothetical protein L2E82_03222 [Cichorium intybus]
MSGSRFNLVAIMALMLAAVQFHGTAAQTTHVVGDALGWTIPPAGPSAYTTWASAQTFSVGDVLLFNFTSGFHNVAEVSQAAYGPCTTSNPISIVTNGPARVTLNAPGTHYFICTVGTHCQIGQKLTINVSAGSATPAPAPAPATPAPVSPPTAAPTPVPSTTTPTPRPTSSPAPSAGEASPVSPPTSSQSPSGSNSPSPTDSTIPPPPSPSFAPSFTAVVPFTFLAMALAFFY